MPPDRPRLAAVLRRAREAVRPEDVGLAAGSRRRVPGLRREELALLAGISVDYVVRLEQGRGPQPSTQVLGALARALRLDVDARDELFRLAGSPPPEEGTVDVHVRPSVLRLIDRFVDLPAFVQSAKGDVLAWNAMSEALQGDWSSLPPEQRNLARLRFLHDPAGERMTPVGGTPEERAAIARQSVANLRRAAARYPRDPDLQRLLRDLRTGSPEFATLWDDTAAGAWRSHRKTLLHPAVGPLTLECDTLHVPDTDQLLVVYSAAPGTPEAEALALLRVLGTQELRERAGASGGVARPT
ncbi:helix-turn-helix transcriptional regulator [Phycicoccus sp. 3266]|uniref:helix-turn-helix domain-containing protein n=1 Tax=Phycicoccus sp. 3266 TaxID=2817751 RepID=UPI0028560AAF|nr:helix-turn-helix transcriptional regulator [Phycicoccus sp. 3266]MDR6864640.1 transcriptional regulator with XRE-family HTH domain [Phycicoccus sp. 3266]